MSERYVTHATPTLFNAGTPLPQMSSCFPVCMKDDSFEGIYDTLKNCALISKSASGIGMSIHNIRPGSYIAGTNGYLKPMLRAYNVSSVYGGPVEIFWGDQEDREPEEWRVLEIPQFKLKWEVWAGSEAWVRVWERLDPWVA
ncbi:hypothetical protein C8J55DRAFT_560945 [Lentinula edodes]|uniref:Ribonucleotide reductase large subunit C-terminal domain-containing protein n=1 Tax=Lentinula lateritia TaxID=40482 RepID=A0A9W9AD33_9AGAR|nr:hypothetical protein C8J55DRAFT_560945 [Lentinula edodes]